MKNSLVIRVWGTGSGGFLGASVDLNAADRVEVLQVLDRSPAKTGGLLTGDVVEALDDLEMRSVTQFSNAIRTRAAGDEITLKIKRGSSTQAIRIRLANRPKEDEG
jgi:S1-C subfamily serine protease